MRKYLTITLLLITSIANAQFEWEGYFGGMATNYIYSEIPEGNLTRTEVAIHVAGKGTVRIADLFQVQGDTASLKATVGIHGFGGLKSGQMAFVPSSGLRLEFPLYLEYGAMSNFKKLRSYFESGFSINDNLSIQTSLINFNPYVKGDLTSYSRIRERRARLKRTLAFGVKLKFN